jgi:hypothetical protein
MNALWRRLLWKEVRGAWLVLAAGTLLPLAGAGAAEYLLMHPAAWVKAWGLLLPADLYLPVMAIAALMLVLWAAERAQDRGRQSIALPLPPAVAWMDCYLPALLVPAWVGTMLAVGDALMGNDGGLTAFPSTAVFLVSITVLTTATVRLASPLPAVMVGTLWLFSGTFQDLFRAVAWVPIALIVVAPLAEQVGRALLRRGWRMAGYVVPLLMLLAVFVVQELPQLADASLDLVHLQSGGGHAFRMSNAQLLDAGGARYVYFKKDGWQYEDFSTRHTATLPLTLYGGIASTRPLAFLSPTRVLMGRQEPDAEMLTLLAWDTTANTTRNLLTLPAGRGALGGGMKAVVSPDSRYLLWETDTTENSDRQRSYEMHIDLWLIDLQTGQAQVAMVLPQRTYAGQTKHDYVWTRDRVSFTYTFELVAIDLQSGRVTRARLPLPKEVAR